MNNLENFLVLIFSFKECVKIYVTAKLQAFHEKIILLQLGPHFLISQLIYSFREVKQFLGNEQYKKNVNKKYKAFVFKTSNKTNDYTNDSCGHLKYKNIR